MIFRKAILLIHGFAGGQYDYGDLGNELEYFNNFDVFTFTLPGHDKARMHKVSYEQWIKAAESSIEKIIDHGYKNIYLVGHSMGGVIASHLACKYHNYVKKLVLATPAFKYMYFRNNKIDIIKTLKESPKIFDGISYEVILSRIFKTSLESAIEFTKLVKDYNKSPEKINCPTIIIHGNNDKIVPEDSCLYVYNSLNISYKVLYKVKEVNHDVFTGNRKDEVNSLVISFLRKKVILNENSIIEI